MAKIRAIGKHFLLLILGQFLLAGCEPPPEAPLGAMQVPAASPPVTPPAPTDPLPLLPTAVIEVVWHEMSDVLHSIDISSADGPCVMDGPFNCVITMPPNVWPPAPITISLSVKPNINHWGDGYFTMYSHYSFTKQIYSDANTPVGQMPFSPTVQIDSTVFPFEDQRRNAIVLRKNPGMLVTCNPDAGALYDHGVNRSTSLTYGGFSFVSFHLNSCFFPGPPQPGCVTYNYLFDNKAWFSVGDYTPKPNIEYQYEVYRDGDVVGVVETYLGFNFPPADYVDLSNLDANGTLLEIRGVEGREFIRLACWPAS